jgi:hypothetical protein
MNVGIGNQKLDLRHRLHPSKVVRWFREKLTAQSSPNLVFVSFEREVAFWGTIRFYRFLGENGIIRDFQ